MENDNHSGHHKVTLELNAFDGRHTFGRVLLDGVEVRGVRYVGIRSGYNSVTEVTLTMIASVSAEIEDANVTETDWKV